MTMQQHKPGCPSGDFGPCDCGEPAPLRAPAPADPYAQAAAIELAYGLLWLAPTDRSTRCGELAYQARQVLLTQLDRDGKLRGLKAAQDKLPAPESRKNSRTDHPYLDNALEYRGKSRGD